VSTHVARGTQMKTCACCIRPAMRLTRDLDVSYEEEDTCMSYEEEDTCMSYEEEEDTCMSYEEEEDTCMSHEEEDTCMSYEEEEDTCMSYMWLCLCHRLQQTSIIRRGGECRGRDTAARV
jgi:hypothetical protein